MSAAPGVVVVEMCPREEEKGGLLLPEDVKTKLRTDYAKVVAVGGDYKDEHCASIPDVEVGDCVVVHPSYGKKIHGFGWDEGFARSETRMYGMNGGPGSEYDFTRYAFDDAVLMTWDFKPRGTNVLLKLAPRQETTDSGIVLPDLAQNRDPVAEVVAVGPGVTQYKPGDKVVYHANALISFEFYKEDHALCKEKEIYGSRT